MISLGSGMQALSIAISRMTTGQPPAAMTPVTHAVTAP